MRCPLHNKEMRDGSYGPYCTTKMPDGSWCKEGKKVGQAPTESYASPQTPSSTAEVVVRLDKVIALLEMLVRATPVSSIGTSVQPAVMPVYATRQNLGLTATPDFPELSAADVPF
jgi:hypothetical protein